MEPYAFLNIEAALIAIVRAQVRVDAGVDIPANRPTEYVQVTRAGGTSELVSDNPMVTFLVWGGTWSSAEQLTSLTRRRVQDVTRLGDHPVYRVRETGGPVRMPDPADGSPRYQFTVEYKLRGSTAPN